MCIYANIDILQILKVHAQSHKNSSLKNQAESYLKMIHDFRNNFENDKTYLDLNRDYTKDNLIQINKKLAVI